MSKYQPEPLDLIFLAKTTQSQNHQRIDVGLLHALAGPSNYYKITSRIKVSRTLFLSSIFYYLSMYSIHFVALSYRFLSEY